MIGLVGRELFGNLLTFTDFLILNLHIEDADFVIVYLNVARLLL